MAASDDDVKKKPNRLEKMAAAFEKDEKLAKIINEIKKTEDSFLTPIGDLNSKYKDIMAILSDANPAMHRQLMELSKAAEALHKDYPAKFFDADGNPSVKAYEEYLGKLNDMTVKSTMFNELYSHDLECHVKIYNRSAPPEKKIVFGNITSLTSLPFQRGPRHELFMNDLIKNSKKGTLVQENALKILESVKNNNSNFNTYLESGKLPVRKNIELINFLMNTRQKLMNMPNNEKAIQMMIGLEKMIANDVDHKLSASEVLPLFKKRLSLLSNPLNDLINEALSAPELSVKKTKAGKPVEPATETPKVEAPKVEAPKVDAPKVDAPKVDAPKAEAPKAEEPKAIKSSVWVHGVTPNTSKPTTTERASSNLAHEKLKTMIVSLNASGWTPTTLPDKSNSTKPIEVAKNGDSFVITPDKLTTASNNVETFKAMLQAFNTANPNKEPRITTNNAQVAAVWQQAYKETYPGKAMPKNLIEVKTAKEPDAPKPVVAAPEERTTPTLK